MTSGAGPVDILRGVDLSVKDGEAVGLVGPSGCGKSTLLSVIGGLEVPQRGLDVGPGQGTVRIGDVDFATLDEDGLARFRRDHIGILFQSFNLIPTMTALENVAIPLELAGDDRAFEKAAAELAVVGLGQRGGHYPGQLSGGEQQRVALARAMIGNPDLLLADEPTGNLDAESGARIIDLIFEMQAQRGATLLLVTHDPGLAARCDRVVTMQDGRLMS